MQVKVNGTALWFDVEGPSLVPAGARLRQQPTVVLIHGGPGSYDHSYFKPAFSRLAAVAQVVYLDLRGHGRSGRGNPRDWNFEQCVDDLRAFCDALGITRPIVFGHSMGGVVAMLFGARYPARPLALILQSTLARFDLSRLVEGFRRVGGDDVAGLAERDYRGDTVSDDEWPRVFAAFGPRVPTSEELARRIRNAELGVHGMRRLRELDIVGRLAGIECPTLVCVGEVDPVTPVEAAREVASALRPGIGELAVLSDAGHFPWLDSPDVYWSVVGGFVVRAARALV